MECEYDLDGWTSCPYDPMHRVPRYRIQHHIIKCEKSYPGWKICRYNATHRFPVEEIKAHIEQCPDKPITDIQKKNITGGQITVPKPILQKEYLSETDPNHECWDKI